MSRLTNHQELTPDETKPNCRNRERPTIHPHASIALIGPNLTKRPMIRTNQNNLRELVPYESVLKLHENVPLKTR